MIQKQINMTNPKKKKKKVTRKKRNQTHWLHEVWYVFGTWQCNNSKWRSFWGQTKRYLHGPNSSISDTTAEFGTREQLDVKHGENKTNNTYIYDRHLLQTVLVEWERADKLEKLNLRDEGNWNLSIRKMTNYIKLPQRCPQNGNEWKRLKAVSFPKFLLHF